ncbi:unnamed protein product, partial [Ectocarpus sp. 4 AP-2014]
PDAGYRPRPTCRLRVDRQLQPTAVQQQEEHEQEERTVDEDSGCGPPKRATRNERPMPRRNQLYCCSLHAVLPTSRCCSV